MSKLSCMLCILHQQLRMTLRMLDVLPAVTNACRQCQSTPPSSLLAHAALGAQHSVLTHVAFLYSKLNPAGAMLEEHKRAAILPALYCLLSAYALEAGALVYATVVNFGLLADTIGSCHTAEELAR